MWVCSPGWVLGPNHSLTARVACCVVLSVSGLVLRVTAGLQQLQLDVCYLRPKLLQLVGGPDAEPVAQVLDEVVAAAAERSTDPTLLEPAAVDNALAGGMAAQP